MNPRSQIRERLPAVLKAGVLSVLIYFGARLLTALPLMGAVTAGAAIGGVGRDVGSYLFSYGLPFLFLVSLIPALPAGLMGATVGLEAIHTRPDAVAARAEAAKRGALLGLLFPAAGVVVGTLVMVAGTTALIRSAVEELFERNPEIAGFFAQVLDGTGIGMPDVSRAGFALLAAVMGTIVTEGLIGAAACVAVAVGASLLIVEQVREHETPAARRLSVMSIGATAGAVTAWLLLAVTIEDVFLFGGSIGGMVLIFRNWKTPGFRALVGTWIALGLGMLYWGMLFTGGMIHILVAGALGGLGTRLVFRAEDAEASIPLLPCPRGVEESPEGGLESGVVTR